MTIGEAVRGWKGRNRELTERVMQAVSGFDEERFNRRRTAGEWSPAQVVEHLVLANAPYLITVEDAVARAKTSSDSVPVRFSFFGRIIRNGLKKAPLLKKLTPKDTRIPLDALTRWEEQQRRIITYLERAEGKDLSGTRVRNPFFGFIPMNLADCFEILTEHTQLHVEQIEERVQ